jgi:hypothetical protein
MKKPVLSISGLTTSHYDPAVRYGKIDAARMLGFSVRTLDYRISQAKLTTTRSGGRVMISRSEILRYGKINDTDPVIAKLPKAA